MQVLARRASRSPRHRRRRAPRTRVGVDPPGARRRLDRCSSNASPRCARAGDGPSSPRDRPARPARPRPPRPRPVPRTPRAAWSPRRAGTPAPVRPATAATVPSARTTAAARVRDGPVEHGPHGPAQSVSLTNPPRCRSSATFASVLRPMVRSLARSRAPSWRKVDSCRDGACRPVRHDAPTSWHEVRSWRDPASDLDRHVGLALPALARRVLPARPAAAPRARPPSPG